MPPKPYEFIGPGGFDFANTGPEGLVAPGVVKMWSFGGNVVCAPIGPTPAEAGIGLIGSQTAAETLACPTFPPELHLFTTPGDVPTSCYVSGRCVAQLWQPVKCRSLMRVVPMLLWMVWGGGNTPRGIPATS